MRTPLSEEVFKVLAPDNLLYGPIDFSTLVQWIKERRVQRETWIHSETSQRWFSAGAVDELRGAFEASNTESTQVASPQLDSVSVEELRQFERFASYSNEELALLIHFSDVLAIQTGDLIIRKGDISDSLFIILTGRVRARMMVGGTETSLGTMAPGELFGEVAMLSHTPRTADVVAEEPTRLLRLSSSHFQNLQAQNASLAAKIFYNLSRLLATRLAERNVQLQKDIASSFVWR